jgi:hypothetical protein
MKTINLRGITNPLSEEELKKVKRADNRPLIPVEVLLILGMVILQNHAKIKKNMIPAHMKEKAEYAGMFLLEDWYARLILCVADDKKTFAARGCLKKAALLNLHPPVKNKSIKQLN